MFSNSFADVLHAAHGESIETEVSQTFIDEWSQTQILLSSGISQYATELHNRLRCTLM